MRRLAFALVLVGCEPRSTLKPGTPIHRAAVLRTPLRGDETLGTPHPMVVKEVAADGSWAYVCQARADTNGDARIDTQFGYHGAPQGDALYPYFISGSGEGTYVDGLLAADPSGRWVVTLEAGALVLRDTVANTTERLSESIAFTDPRIGSLASFDATGEWLLYRQAPEATGPATLRNLRTRVEKPAPKFAGLWTSISLSPAADAVVARVLTKDTNHDGKLSPIPLATNRSLHRCAGNPTSYTQFAGRDGDVETTVAIPLFGDPIVADSGIFIPVKGGVVTRSSTLDLQYQRYGGAAEPLLVSECSRDFWAYDWNTVHVIASCGKTTKVVGPEGAHTITGEARLGRPQDGLVFAIDSPRRGLLAIDISDDSVVEVADLVREKVPDAAWLVVSQWRDGFVAKANRSFVGVERDPVSKTWAARQWVRDCAGYEVSFVSNDVVQLCDGEVVSIRAGTKVHVAGKPIASQRGGVLTTSSQTHGPLIWLPW